MYTDKINEYVLGNVSAKTLNLTDLEVDLINSAFHDVDIKALSDSEYDEIVSDLNDRLRWHTQLQNWTETEFLEDFLQEKGFTLRETVKQIDNGTCIKDYKTIINELYADCENKPSLEDLKNNKVTNIEQIIYKLDGITYLDSFVVYAND